MDNNWHLFGLTVEAVLCDLSGEGEIDPQKYQRIKAFYVGEGWFRDGARGNYDYYNAWGFHYSLYWLDQIDPQFDRAFIHDALRQFNDGYRHLITPRGSPSSAAAPAIAWPPPHRCWRRPVRLRRRRAWAVRGGRWR